MEYDGCDDGGCAELKLAKVERPKHKERQKTVYIRWNRLKKSFKSNQRPREHDIHTF